MPEFIENPRRAPRAAIPCAARVATLPGGFLEAPTADCGPGGCQLLTPVPLEKGTRVFVQLLNERVPGTHALAGRVAWSASAPPWRAGIAFDAGSAYRSSHLFGQLTAAYPGTDAYARAPDRIAADASLAPSPPPPLDPVLSEAESVVLRAVGAGARADALREKLGARWDALLNPLFALLGRGYLVVGPPDGGAAEAWTKHLKS
jgi:hypothetical protein